MILQILALIGFSMLALTGMSAIALNSHKWDGPDAQDMRPVSRHGA